MKKAICFILAIAMLLPFALPAFAAPDTGAEYCSITVNYAGVVTDRTVLRKSGTVYAPLEWLTYFGFNPTYREEGSLRVYNPALGQEKATDFAIRLIIDTKKKTYCMALYFTDSMFSVLGITEKQRVYGHYFPLYQGKFADLLSYDGELWLPIAQLLPFLPVTAAADEDTGILCMSPVPMTTMQALYKHADKFNDLLFDADAVYGSEVMTAGGYAVSTIMDLRIDRLDVIFGSGKTNDYETIFKDYLQDNEAYLSTFNADTDLETQLFSEMAHNMSGMKGAFSIFKESATLFEYYYKLMVKNSCFYDTYKDYATTGQSALDIGSAIISVIEYGRLYLSQIDDHRLMLGAVYDYYAKHTASAKSAGYSNITKWPSYKAAQNIQKIYDKQHLDSKALVKEGVRDMLNDIITGEIKKATADVLGPWFIAIAITKAFCAEEYKFVATSGLMEMIDNTVEFSHTVYHARLSDQDYSAANLNKIRLCAIMSMISSRHAYVSYWGKDGARKDDIAAIDEILYDLYLSGAYQDFDAADTYTKLSKQYKDLHKDLIITGLDPITTAELCLTTTSLSTNASPDVWDSFRYALVDNNDDGQRDIVFSYYLTDSAAQTMRVVLYPSSGGCSLWPYDTDSHTDKTLYTHPDVSRTALYGDTGTILAALDDWADDRHGFVCAADADVNSDTKPDRVYVFYNALGMWNEGLTDEDYVYFNDPYYTTLVAEQTATGVMLQVNVLTEQPSLATAEHPLEEIILDTTVKAEENALQINNCLYAYDFSRGYEFWQWHLPAGYQISAEKILSGDFATLSLQYDDTTWATAQACGEDLLLEIIDGRVDFLRVTHNSGSMHLVDNAYSAMTFGQLKAALPNAVFMEDDAPLFNPDGSAYWPEPYPVYGFGDVEWYESWSFWAAADGRIFQLCVGLNGADDSAPIRFVSFDEIVDPSDNMRAYVGARR